MAMFSHDQEGSSPQKQGPPSHVKGLHTSQQNNIKRFGVQHPFAKKVQPKLRKMVIQQIKLVAKWLHTQFSWKVFLMGWMVMLIASKMLLLALTYNYFPMTSFVSLQVYHGVWTITFFILIFLDSRARLLPNASCLLACYLPSTTLLHILLLPDHFPLPYMITDACSTLLAILIMFLILRMECGHILAQAEERWQNKSQLSPSDAGTQSTIVSSGPPSPQMTRQVVNTGEESLGCPGEHEYPSLESRGTMEMQSNNRGYDEAIDLEPIDFEHFMEDSEHVGEQHLEMFRVPSDEDWTRGR